MTDEDLKIIDWVNRQVDAVKDRDIVVGEDVYSNIVHVNENMQLRTAEHFLKIIRLLDLEYETEKETNKKFTYVGRATSKYRGITITFVARTEDEWVIVNDRSNENLIKSYDQEETDEESETIEHS